MKKRRCFYAFIGAVILLLTSGVMALKLQECVPNAVEVDLVSGTEIAISKQAFGLSAQVEGEVENDPKVQLVVTNSKYGEILPLQWVEGGYFPTEKEYYAVIPDTLATNGEALLIADETYTICGVYKTNPWERNTVIYISSGEEEIFAEQALIAGELEPVQELLHNASESCGIRISGDTFDLRSVRILASQLVYLGFFFGMCGILKKMFFYGGNILVGLYDWKEKYSMSFFMQILKAVSVIVIACMLLQFGLSGIHIPGEYLPADNLFELTHYWELLENFYEKRKLISCLNAYIDTIALFMPLIAGCNTMAIVSWGMFIWNCNSAPNPLYLEA